ncbi:hypothetical protein RUM43_002578 [Polyplax serrata]|uniref:Uncharacterized protein n=1 Tax=Polyplax serrata TaxID=468196 RepID=A0AAN8S4W2_POLSC
MAGVGSGRQRGRTDSSREYPCDHYTAIINVTLMNTGCPRTQVHETALQLLQVLDKRFFGNVGPLTTEGDSAVLNILVALAVSKPHVFTAELRQVREQEDILRPRRC